MLVYWLRSVALSIMECMARARGRQTGVSSPSSENAVSTGKSGEVWKLDNTCPIIWRSLFHFRYDMAPTRPLGPTRQKDETTCAFNRLCKAISPEAGERRPHLRTSLHDYIYVSRPTRRKSTITKS